jgi:hypothetical protein
MPATIGTAISATNKVFCSHYPVPVFQVKIPSFSQIIAETQIIIKIIPVIHVMNIEKLPLHLTNTKRSKKMGIERDYLMRQLMMLFDVIQKIFNFRKKGQKEEAEDQIRYFYKSLNMEMEIQEKSIEALLDYLVSEKKFTNNHLEMIAFVLKEQGELAEDAAKKLDFFRKAYFLLEKADRESTSFSMDRQMKLAELREYLN